MKRRVRQLALLLAAVMLLSVTALAEEGTVDGEKATITDIYSGATATFDTSNPDIINVTFTSPDLDEGGQYLILMIKGSESDYTITEDSILYIDQTAATGNGDGTATIEFDVYPSSIQDSVILITGVNNGPLVAAIVNAKYILGDVTGDGFIDAFDAVAVLRYAARLTGAELTGTALSAANVNGDTFVDAFDAVYIVQLRAGLIPKFPAES